MPPRRAAAARGGRRPAGVPGPQQVVVGLGTSFFGAPAKKLHHQPLLRDRRLGPLRQVPSRALSTRSAEQLDLRVFCIRFAARRCFRWRALPASPDRPPGPPGPSTSTGQGRARPASGRWGGIHGFRGASGDVRVLGPGFPPDLRPPRAPPLAPLVLPPESLPWLNASLQGRQGLPSPPLSARRAMRALLGAVRTLLVRGGPARHVLSSLRAPGLPAAAAGRPRTAAQVARPRQAGAAERGPRERGGLGRALGRLPSLPSPPTRPSRLASASVLPSRLEAKATGPGRRRRCHRTDAR